jgi:DNA polymerase-1
VHDTLFSAFLDDPRAETLSLKPLAAKYLRRRAGERDELYEWIAANVRVGGKKVPKSQLGAHICQAPAKMVGRYAMADAEMTLNLHDKLHRIITARGMGPAYQREIDLVPITLEMERTGLRVDVQGLVKLSFALEQVVVNFDKNIRKVLRVDDTFNVDSGPQLGAALMKAGKLSKPTYTATGKQSTAKDTLIDTCNDSKLVMLLAVRGVADTYLNTFVQPWIARASKTGGYIQPRFNQVRNRNEAGQGGGARSGRYSSSNPNFQNVASNAEDSSNRDTLLLLIAALAEVGFPEFIGLRDYFLPDEGKIWAAIDYSQQELRILAHFEGGPLMAQYIRDPRMDVHTWVQQLIKERTGTLYERKFIKACIFQQLYGGGAKSLAKKLKIDLKSAYRLRSDIFAAMPGVKSLIDNTKGAIVTFGGRHYDVEAPKFFPGDQDTEGEWASYEYRQINYLIQPSAADYTKMGMLEVHRDVPECRIACQIHDELSMQVESKEQAVAIASSMCKPKLCVPMLADVKLSRETWARCK